MAVSRLKDGEVINEDNANEYTDNPGSIRVFCDGDKIDCCVEAMAGENGYVSFFKKQGKFGVVQDENGEPKGFIKNGKVQVMYETKK